MEVKVRGVMTCARHEITYARTIIEQATRAVGVPLCVSLGVFYHQQMQRMFEQALADGLDYIVTIDGDSVFTAQQLHKLIATAATLELDALASFQCKRGSPNVLAYKQGQTKAQWSGDPVPVDAAHFGLTVLKVSKLSGVAKPWFVCKPDADGRWEDGRIDSDVWFWKQWKDAGNGLYIDPSIRIGHVEEMVTCHDEEFGVRHLYPKDWDAEMKAGLHMLDGEESQEEVVNDKTDEALEAVSSGETA